MALSDLVLAAIVSSISALAGVVVGFATEPIKLWATHKSRRDDLHLALYGEIADISEFFVSRVKTLIGYSAGMSAYDSQSKRRSGNSSDAGALDESGTSSDTDVLVTGTKVLGIESASYDVYTYIKKEDPTLFYQLDDFQKIDDTYLSLKQYDAEFLLYRSWFKPPQLVKILTLQLRMTFDGIHRYGLNENLLHKVNARFILDPSTFSQELKDMQSLSLETLKDVAPETAAAFSELIDVVSQNVTETPDTNANKESGNKQ